jgi:hypothetical protein
VIIGAAIRLHQLRQAAATRAVARANPAYINKPYFRRRSVRSLNAKRLLLFRIDSWR